MATPSMRTLSKQLHARAREQQRHLRLLFGAPVPLQPRSTTAGVWAGVMQFSDTPAAPFKLSWPDSQYLLGRVQVSQFRCGKHTITATNLYGWPSSAFDHTNSLIDHLTREIILGRQGLRFVAGDFNASADKLAAIHMWKQCGWVEAQELHQQLTGQPPLPTYRGQPRPDRLHLSPELAGCFRDCQVKQDFADHATIRANFVLPDSHAATFTCAGSNSLELNCSRHMENSSHKLPAPGTTQWHHHRHLQICLPVRHSKPMDYPHFLQPAKGKANGSRQSSASHNNSRFAPVGQEKYRTPSTTPSSNGSSNCADSRAFSTL